MFINKPQTLLELKKKKTNNGRKITTIDVNMLQIYGRIVGCIENEGRHVGNIIFKN